MNNVKNVINMLSDNDVMIIMLKSGDNCFVVHGKNLQINHSQRNKIF